MGTDNGETTDWTAVKRGLGILVALCVAPFIGTAPAQAVSGGSVTVPNIVLFDGCADQPLNYSITVEPATRRM